MHSRPRSVCLVGLIAAGRGGIPRYAVKLTQALDALSPEYPQLRLTLLTTAAGAAAVAPHHLRVHTVGAALRALDAGPGRLFVEQAAVRLRRDDILHFFDLTGPLLAPSRPFVTTIHDMAPLEGFAPRRNLYKRRLYPWALRRAAAAVAVSAFAKREAVRHLRAAPDKIEVIHSGPGFVEGPDGADESGRRDEAADPFLLYVGSIDANKNLPMLVRAFDEAQVPGKLLLVGWQREGAAQVRQAVAATGRERQVELVENASDDELDRLYRSATALVLPSTYEGFGFTPLEAMLRDCPVLASDIPALREVSGTGSLLLPPNDQSAWAEAMRRVAHDGELRNRLRVAGAETARRYSWEKTARGVLELFGTLAL